MDGLDIMQTWKDAPLPPVLEDSARTWCPSALGPSVRRFLARDSFLIPWLRRQGPVLSHCLQDGPFIRTVDMFRYCYLARFGGLYVDLDFYCVRSPLRLLHERHAAVVLGSMRTPGELDSHSIPNAFMYSPAGHPFWVLVLAMAKARVAEPFIEAATGPVLLHDAVQKYSEVKDSAAALRGIRGVPEVAAALDVGVVDPLPEVTVLPPRFFYPLSWAIPEHRREIASLSAGLHSTESRRIIDGMRSSADTYAFTFWFRSWSRQTGTGNRIK
ncbi:glycosyltransferase [Kitasatospora sp. NPDC056783]|uniref:glycosyltransferase n=1 Tax=Kitasatospora sp. NPDC056783 TaxID=3345943 RepID=UPI0036AF0E44